MTKVEIPQQDSATLTDTIVPIVTETEMFLETITDANGLKRIHAEAYERALPRTNEWYANTRRRPNVYL